VNYPRLPYNIIKALRSHLYQRSFIYNDDIPHAEVVQKMDALSRALKADVEWLTQVVTSENEDDLPVEWLG